MQKIAIPVFNNKDVNVFGSCLYYKVYTIEEEMPLEELVFHKLLLPKEFSVYDLPDFLSNAGVTDLVLYTLPTEIIKLFAIKKIQVYIGIRESESKEILKQMVSGTLRSNTLIINNNEN